MEDPLFIKTGKTIERTVSAVIYFAVNDGDALGNAAESAAAVVLESAGIDAALGTILIDKLLKREANAAVAVGHTDKNARGIKNGYHVADKTVALDVGENDAVPVVIDKTVSILAVIGLCSFTSLNGDERGIGSDILIHLLNAPDLFKLIRGEEYLRDKLEAARLIHGTDENITQRGRRAFDDYILKRKAGAADDDAGDDDETGYPVPDTLALSALEFFLAARFGLGSLVVGLVYVYSIVYFGFADSFLHCYTFAVLFNKRTYTLAGVDTMIQITNVFYHKATKLTSNI